MTKRQTEIPGTERKSIKELDSAAEAYREERDARMKKSEHESVAKQALIDLMKKHKVDVYRDDDAGIVVTLIPGKDGVKVTEAENESGEEEAA